MKFKKIKNGFIWIEKEACCWRIKIILWAYPNSRHNHDSYILHADTIPFSECPQCKMKIEGED